MWQYEADVEKIELTNLFGAVSDVWKSFWSLIEVGRRTFVLTILQEMNEIFNFQHAKDSGIHR